MFVFRHLFCCKHLVTNEVWKAVTGIRGILAEWWYSSGTAILQAESLTLKSFTPKRLLFDGEYLNPEDFTMETEQQNKGKGPP